MSTKDYLLRLTGRDLDYLTQEDAKRVWHAGNNAGWGETPEDYTQEDSIDPDAGVNDLAGVLDGELILRSGSEQEIAVYRVDDRILGVGDCNGLWLVRLGDVLE